LAGCWIVLICAQVSCRAKPAPDAGFLQDTQLMKPDKDFPFNRTYLSQEHHDKHYSEIYVAPVDTDHIFNLDIWEFSSTANLFPNDVKKNHQMLANYLRNEFIKQIQNDPDKRFTVVDKPGPNTLILEMALVQYVPAKPILNAAEYVTVYAFAATIVLPAVSGSEDQGQGLLALEARLRDGDTGEIVGMFADRERPPLCAVNVRAFLWWEDLKPIIETWAKQFVAMENGVRGEENEPYPGWAIIVF
jgi:hypothetical protein